MWFLPKKVIGHVSLAKDQKGGMKLKLSSEKKYWNKDVD